MFPSHWLTAEEGGPLLPVVANSQSKGAARPPFDLLNCLHKQTGDMSLAPASAPLMSGLERCIALRLVYGAGQKKNATCISSQRLSLLSHVSVVSCVLARTRVSTSLQPVPGSHTVTDKRKKTSFFRRLHRCCSETRTKESNMNMPVSQECLERRTKESTRLDRRRQASAWVVAPTPPFSFAVRTKQSTTCFQVLCECLEMCTTSNRPWS